MTEEYACERCQGMGWVRHGLNYPDCPVCEGTCIDPLSVAPVGKIWRSGDWICLLINDGTSQATVSLTIAQARNLSQRINTAMNTVPAEVATWGG